MDAREYHHEALRRAEGMAAPPRLHGNHGHHHHGDEPYWPYGGTPSPHGPPDPNVPETPPDHLSDAEKELWRFRREIGPQHMRWHMDMPRPGTETTRDNINFFDYHRELLEADNRERERLGLPPLGPMDPPPPPVLCPTRPDGTPIRDPAGNPLEVSRPDPNDPKYQGNFDLFARDLKLYHDVFHGMNPDIGHPNSNVMQDKFYEFHHWIEQQYQDWRAANPDWQPPA